MDIAQIYMLALRSTMVPIAGESWAAAPFFGQVELEGWSWDLCNAEEKVRAQRIQSNYQKLSGELQEAKGKGLKKKFEDLRKGIDNDATQKKIDQLKAEIARSEKEMKANFADGKKVDSGLGISKAVYNQLSGLEDSLARQAEETSKLVNQAESDFDRDLRKNKEKSLEALSDQEAIEELKSQNYEFTFRKRVDISTTQLLNCLKSGDKLKSVTLTMHQSSSNTPWILVFTLLGVRLKDYKLRVEASETMTDMKEDWTAEFEHFSYVYQNRPHAGLKSATAGGVTTTAARAVTQSTVRTFVMVPRRLGL
jgi:type VI protein secretion system component Hcp